ncbi:MAG TPA: helix-turn-helix domain-containing protein [Actinomycetes bacterium]|jgi:transcriptional regulator with XRE-family HTH domain/DNA-binding CsgD family transcriptional regulator|nr:helix-turn-helix domain-containing protein [Actinomycetes bacterium]
MSSTPAPHASDPVELLCGLAELGYDGIAAAVGVVRAHTGLGTPELAAQIGLPPIALVAWERGSFIPRTHHLLRLATILATHPPSGTAYHAVQAETRPQPTATREPPPTMTAPTTPTAPTGPTAPTRAAGVAGVIRRARLAAGLSQSEVATGIGIAQTSVSQWERGLTTPTVPMFAALVGVLGPWPLLEALLSTDQLARAIQAAELHVTAPSSSSQMPLGQCIRAARQAAGLTQAQVGARVGVGQHTVSQWETSRILPMLPMLRRLVAELGVWPLLAALLPPQPEQPAGATGTSLVLRPSPEELARLVVQEGRSDEALAAHYRQPIGVIRRWRRTYQLHRPAVPRPNGHPTRFARPTRQELALAIRQGHSDQELAARYGCSPATVKSWRAGYGLFRQRRGIDRERVLALLRQGLAAGEVAEQVGCTTSPIYQIARAADLHMATDAGSRAHRQGRDDQELTAAEVAGLFQVSETAVHKWANQDRLPFRWVKGQRHFPAPAVVRLAHQHQVPLPDWLAAASNGTSSEASQ